MKELFPPIMPSYIPAFDYSEANNGGIVVPFKLSSYNTISQVKQIQVVIRHQTNNRTALKTGYYNEIIALPFGESSEVTGLNDYPFYIRIPGSTYLQSGFQSGQIYKIQIRLSSVSISTNPTAAQLSANLDNFSEWSTVCLLMPITKPTIYINEFSSIYESSSADSTSQLTFSAGDAVFNWGYQGHGGETAKTYRLRLYRSNTLIGDSGICKVNTYNLVGDNASGYYDFSLQLDANLQFTLILDMTTKNGYVISRSYSFETYQNLRSNFNPTITTEINEEEAYIRVHVTAEDRANIILTLRRSSSKDNFATWIDMTNLTLKNVFPDFTYEDFTVESGVVYQYGIQVRDNNRRRSTLIRSVYVYGTFDHAYLLGRSGGLENTTQQLKLKFNTTVSSFATTVLEEKTETIGSKYPYIARNGNTYYRTFPIAGLITQFMDEGGYFATRDDIYSSSKDLIDAFNESRRNYINSFMKHDETDNEIEEGVSGQDSLLYDEMYDYSYERDFREKVMAFLYEDKVRLFKSPTEGNILVRLMEITFTPHDELGRLVYDFSATAVEVDDCTTENLAKYGIQYIAPYVADLSYTEDRIGQLNSFDNTFPANVNINTMIRSKHHIGQIVNGIHYMNGVIKYLRIEFESAPYLINKATMRPATRVDSADAVTGWIINYNSTPILVMYPNNIYELKDDNVSINASTQITFPAKVEATIDYVISLQEEPESNSKIILKVEYERRIGQLFNTFVSSYNFINAILYRYTYDEEGYSQSINTINYIEIEAEPGTVFYISQDNNTTLRRFVMNFTGSLHLEPEEDVASFKRGFFYGVNIDADLVQNNLGIVTALPSVAKQYSICTYLDNQYIFYNNQWLLATYVVNENSYDLQCSVDGIINYYLQTIRRIYK